MLTDSLLAINPAAQGLSQVSFELGPMDERKCWQRPVTAIVCQRM